MSAPSLSSFEGHATPIQTRKPTTRTVAQRKVYGKRRTNAPRAVFNQGSPTKEAPPLSLKPSHDAVQAIQTQLAKVSLAEEPTPSDEESHCSPPRDTAESDDTSTESQVSDDQSSSSTSPRKLSDTSTEQSPAEISRENRKIYETMLEVRVCNNTIHTTPSITDTCGNNGDVPVLKENSSSKTGFSARRSSGFVDNDKANAYVRPILNEALSPIAARGIQKFDTWASRSASMFHVAKLAEGSYGEVYKLHLREEGNRPMVSKSKLAKLTAYGEGVFKVVPLRAQRGPRSKKFTSVEEIVSEVKLLKYLDPIPGFARFREIHVVQGRFPASFQEAWEHYRNTKDDCMNPDPASKKAYPDTQLWAILEMDDAGCELEKFSWSSTFQIYDIFWGVAMALARAEEYAKFEHRDLHLGNVCIRSTRPNGSLEIPTNLDVARKSSPSGFGISSIETTIIDYSLSRADLRLADSPDDPEGVIDIASSDLDQKQIFDAIGQDDDEILLRDTYRYMRATLYTGFPLQTEQTPDIPGIWAEYAPRTNLVWLLFILKNLLKNRKPASQVAQPSPPTQRRPLASCSPNKTMDRQPDKGKTLKTNDFNRTGILVKDKQSSDLHTRVTQLEQTLEDRLKAVLKLLDLENGHEDMCCAADLVAYAMDSQWLVEDDFF